MVHQLALGMECRVLRSGTQQCDTPSEPASWGPSVLYPKQSLAGRGLRGSTDHLVYIDGLSSLTSG